MRRRIAVITVGVVCASLLSAGIGNAQEPITTSGAGAVSLKSGWEIQSSAVVGNDGAAISDPGYATDGWLPISQPQTLMAALVENGRYPDVFRSNNLAAVPKDQFAVNWWYRDEVRLRPRDGQRISLVMNGVLSRANLWVNGTKVADQSQLQGAYSRFEYDITPYARDGVNAIALDVFRNDVSSATGYLTLNMLDWNHASPDNYTGIQFAPQLAIDGPVSVRDAHVVQDNADDLSTSDLTVKADVRNNTATAQKVDVTATISGPHRFTVRQAVDVPANSTVKVSVGPLHIAKPAVWWPHQMGGQPLYHLDVAAKTGKKISDRYGQDFGIRTVTSHLTPVVPGQTLGSAGYRQYVINGVPFVVRGGGWSQDLFLRYDSGNVRNQLKYIKNMGLNAVRFEGNLPPDDMFRQMDREGVLALPGWQCCAKWEQSSTRWSDETKANAANQATFVAQWLRNHPSVVSFWHSSDNAPDAVKESIWLDAFNAADWQTPQLASAQYRASPRMGQSGNKEGPYNYAPPAYWWENGPVMANQPDAFTNAGGAFGFNTEAGPGNTVPTTDSLNRFLPVEDQNKIWDPASTTGPTSGPDIYHTSPFTTYTAIGRMGQYNTALWNRYGAWSDLASYQQAAQAGGYEITRALFEAYIGNAKDPANPSTGLIYWQMNKAWPSLQWNLYGYDLDQSGVFFGAKKANEAVHVMYSYADGSVRVANLTNVEQRGLRAKAEFVDLDGTVRAVHETAVDPLAGQDVRTVLTPAVPAGISTTYFLRLTLKNGPKTVSRNVYWLSTKPDRVDWANTIDEGDGAAFEPGGYADLTGLRSLGAASVRVRATTLRLGADDMTRVTVTNTSDHPVPAFMTRADIRRDTGTGDNQVLPILWSDNDITLWPGESQTIVATYRHADLKGARPVVTVAGWNVAPQVA
ncbi:glycoside hydrolase family 2 protein [Virgisporangium aurantiacum]|uniref:Beta-mannosidase n=1 Tax=Virgisporangium aurantiacum TaxID=175570 RepID=A0A8J3ZE44_9ACTN|nr:sugar-binding domain-containing protein [Virgisporangium aurantiacum]GIJ60135.1 beta-mannosidase [Virgisporangium aurantiacum]